MKRFTIYVTLIAVFMSLLSIQTYAMDENIDTYKEEFDFESIFDTLDSDTLHILEELGISEISFENVFSVNPGKIFDALFNILSDSVQLPCQFLLSVLGILIVCSLVSSFAQNSDVVDLIGGGAVALSLCMPIANLVTTAFSVLESLMVFTSAFAGVFCALVSSAGNLSLGVVYGSFTAIFDTVSSAVLVNLSHPLVNAMCSLGFLSCFDFYGLSVRLSCVVKRIYVFALSFTGSAFSGIVALKGVLGNSADSLSSRSIRFIIGQSLPVVGGAVSETYLTLTRSLSLIKNTVGVFGIITVIVFVLPTVFQLFSWTIVLELSNTAATVMGIESSKNLISVLKDVTVLLISTIVILTMIFIVCVGVAIAARDGVI